MRSNIQVFVRCRPLAKSEFNIPVPIEVYPELHKILVRDTGTDKSTVKTFTYDKVFGPEASQAEIYSEIVAPLVEEVIQGFNCTIFAYGQTGTGKTFTIEGDRSTKFPEKSDDPLSGIIPRSIKHLFSELSDPSLKYDICVSFLELYNEEIFDLLSKTDDLIKLKMYENYYQKGSVIVQGLEVVTVKSMDEVYGILEKGCRKRRKAVTLLNKASSRSHTIFTVTVSVKESSTTLEKVKSGKLNLVDLAGSENIGRSGAINKRAREAGNINQSLLALGRVITSLCEKAGHIPYRESKLTRLLQDSLGGQTKTAVIATISPSAMHIDETLNTLEYALRAKSITNKPESNAQVTVNSIILDYLEKINLLRKEIYEMAKTKGVYASEENIRNWKSLLEEKREEKFKLLLQVESLSEENKTLDDAILELQSKLEEKKTRLGNVKANFEKHKIQLKKAKVQHKLHEMMFDVMQPTYNCMHEKYDKTLEEIKVLELETAKRKGAVADVLAEYRRSRETLDSIRSKHKVWNEAFRQDSENLMKDMRNMNDSVNLMTTECKHQASMLKYGFDARKSDCEKTFEDISKAVIDLEAINNDFQKNFDVSLLEEKTTKLKSIEDFEKVYSSSIKTDPLESLNPILDLCESSLRNLSMAASEWKKEAKSEMATRKKLLEEHKSNIKNTFEHTTENVKALLNRQKESLEEINSIALESLNSERVSKKTVIDKFRTIEQAVSSLDIYCTEANENEVDKTNLAHSSMKNYVALGSEIVEKLSDYGENSTKNIDDMYAEAEDHVPGIFSEKWEELKTKEDSAFSRYKNLTEELERLSQTNQSFCGIRDSVRRVLEDIDESNEQLRVSKSVRVMADSIMERGNSFLSRMVKNYTEVEASLSKDKQTMDALAESSKRLSKTIDSTISDCHQFLRNDLLKRFAGKDSEENITRSEASFDGTNTLVSERTLCLLNATSELTLPHQESVPENEGAMCSKNTDEFLKVDSIQFSKGLSRDNTDGLSGTSNSFLSSYPWSPVKRSRSKNSTAARKNLLFPDIEKLADELLENSSGDGS